MVVPTVAQATDDDTASAPTAPPVESKPPVLRAAPAPGGEKIRLGDIADLSDNFDKSGKIGFRQGDRAVGSEGAGEWDRRSRRA